MREIARRTCWIRAPDDPEVSTLTIILYAPSGSLQTGYEAPFRLESRYFEKARSALGLTGMHALVVQPFTVQAYLHRRLEEGYEIYWREPGDFDLRAFWIVPADQPVYCPA